MNLKTKQIIDELELVLGKFNGEITEEDLSTITELTIRNFDIDGTILEFYLEDLQFFANLRKLTFVDMIIDIDTVNYIFNSNINDLTFRNCELLCVIDKPFERIETLRVERTDNFKEEFLAYFPNVKDLTFKGYTVTKDIPANVKKLNIANSTISDIGIIERANLDELYISKDEYEKNTEFYKKMLNVFVYDNNNVYLVNDGDENE